MKKNIFSIFVVATSILMATLAGACQEKADTEKPVITLEEPMTNDTISVATDSVHIHLTATDNIGLHELTITIKDAAGATVFTDAPDVHDLKTYSYHDHYIPTGVTALAPLTLTIAAADHDDNMETKTVNFFVKP